MSYNIFLRPRLALLLLLSSWAISAHSQRACYWPNGSPTASTNNNFIPCNAEGVSHCCNEGEACLSNGLCFGAEAGLMYRGACTDKTWEEDTAECPLFCTELPKSADMHMCPDLGIWCGNGTRCEQGDSTNSTIAELHSWTNATGPMYIANVSTTASSSTASAAAAATSSSCIAGVCLSTVKCLPISVPISVGAGVGLPLAICVLVLGIMLRREKKQRRIGLLRKEDSDMRMSVDAPAHRNVHRDKNFKWNQDYSSETHMLGGDQIHELGTHSYELPPSGRAK